MPGPDEPLLAVDEIQGNVMPGFNTRHQVLLGLRFESDPDSVGRAREWLGRFVPSVSTLREVYDFREVRRSRLAMGLDRPAASPRWTNVAFDVNGLARLGADVAKVRDVRFRQGMGVESGLGDPKDPAHDGHPGRWVVGGTPDKTPEVLVVLGCDDGSELRAQAAEVRHDAEASGLATVYEEDGHVLEGEVEHFGFRDGISTVGPRGRVAEGGESFLTRRYLDPADERFVRFGRPGQPLVWPGQFVFGYPRQRADDPVVPGPVRDGGAEWMANGSFVAFRRLRQDVAAFRQFVDEEGARIGLAPERLAALLVGRWPKGTALIRNPEHDDVDPMGDRMTVNDFGYGGDRFGRVCPGFAHVRKVNPRDLATDKGGAHRTLTFAVLRRGITFGEPFPAEGERGLLFLSYQTSIKEQFELLNADWMNRVNGPEGDTGQDLLVGQGSGTTRERTAVLRSSHAGGEPTRITTLAEWVIPTGGGYFFTPSVSALRSFSEQPE